MTSSKRYAIDHKDASLTSAPNEQEKITKALKIMKNIKIISETNLQWMIDNYPGMVFDYHPHKVAHRRPYWAAMKKKRWMGENHPHVTALHNIRHMVWYDSAWVANNYPERMMSIQTDLLIAYRLGWAISNYPEYMFQEREARVNEFVAHQKKLVKEKRRKGEK